MNSARDEIELALHCLDTGGRKVCRPDTAKTHLRRALDALDVAESAKVERKPAVRQEPLRDAAADLMSALVRADGQSSCSATIVVTNQFGETRLAHVVVLNGKGSVNVRPV